MRDARYSLPVSLGSYQLSPPPPLIFTFNLSPNIFFFFLIPETPITVHLLLH